jgi:hypothetical protein
MPEDLDKLIADGRDAERALHDEVLMAAFAEAETEYIFKWRNSKSGETVVREESYHRLKALERIKEAIGITRDRGAKATNDLVVQRQREEFRKRTQ